ncbi:MAG TPA: DUF5668 domain-containing protein [Bacteroidota bacterium]
MQDPTVESGPVSTQGPAGAPARRRGERYISGRLIVGVGIILFGVLLLLDNLNILYAQDYLQFWPLILIAVGVLRLVQPSTPGGRVWGAVVTALGVIFLLNSLNITELRFHDVWPVLLVVIGGAIIWGNSTRKREAFQPMSVASSDSFIVGSAVLGGFSRTSNSQAFRGGDLTAIMGGCEIDLRRASMEGNEAVINVFAFWGGVELKVPTTWSVSLRGVPILGGFSDETLQPGEPGAKKLVVTGTAIMGGFEVTN